ncbi:hypothetical protein BDW22DRAFT_1364331 [Trametopsis cervina]|nr:hypothetical protein BDW22DRAFT_1364331 [Trametopsis cervina]
MSSDEHEDSPHESIKHKKKRRIGRACDLCRQKKVRCDGEQRPGKRCSNCTAYDDECTYVRTAPKRRSRPKGYTEHLEKRIAKMEELLEQLCPGVDFTRDLEAMAEDSTKVSDHETDASDRDADASLVRSVDADTSFDYAIPPSLDTQATTHHVSNRSSPKSDLDEEEEELESSGDELLTRHRVVQQFSGISLDDLKLDRRFFGKSSTFMMVKEAADLKKQHLPDSTGSSPDSGVKAGLTFPSVTDNAGVSYLPCGCPEYGSFNPWAMAQPAYGSPHHGGFEFPPADLLSSLVSLFFRMHNNFTPVLHRPTFDRMLADKRHLVDEDFASIVLLVCAIGSRWSTDRRVLLEEEERSNEDGEGEEWWHSSGWKWFKQVRLGRKALFSPPCLADIQITCLAAMYHRGSSTSEASRTLIGVGLRLAQDIGAHRRKMYSSLSPAEGEMLKRAFWTLVWQDWALSPQLGRPCGVQYEDFDLDLLIECDDEYWTQTGATVEFRQPTDKSPRVSFFNCFLRLNQIQAFAMRTIYSTTKSKTILGFVGPQWEERIVADLDSALNNWMDSIPHHLRWDPRVTDPISLSQSAILYAAYCTLQITIHRPFISYTRALPSTPFVSPEASRLPSLTICVNAARSCVHILDLVWKKLGHMSDYAAVALQYSLIPIFNCGIVLMLNMLGRIEANKSNPNRSNRDALADMKEMADVHLAMDMLKFIEHRWYTAGKLWDMLYELAVVGDLPLPSYSHASVLRTSKTQSTPFRSKQPSGPHGFQIPPIRSLLQMDASGNRIPPKSVSPSAVVMERSSIHQALYPKHAHLFDTSQNIPSPEWDLSPSVFAQSSAAMETGTSDQPEMSNGNEYTQLDVPGPNNPFATAEYDAALNMGLVQEDWQSGIPAIEAPSIYTDWTLPLVSSDLAALQQAQATTSSRIVPPSQVFTDSYSTIPAETSFMFRSQDSIRMDVNGALADAFGGISHSDQPSMTLPANIMPQYAPDASPFPTASDFLVGTLPDTEESRATLAMWSTVPSNFDWDNWGSYINSLGNPETGNFPSAGPQPPAMYRAQ